MRFVWMHDERGWTLPSRSGLLLVLLAASLGAAPRDADDRQPQVPDEPLLQPGVPLELPLDASAPACRVLLRPGEFVEIHAEQIIDLRLTLLDPTGAEVVSNDLRRPQQGPEQLYAVAGIGGEHRVRAAPARGLAGGGRSTITVVNLRPATDRDQALAKAAVLYARAAALEDAKTGDGRRQAIDDYRQAIVLWRAAEALFEEGRTLHQLGGQYSRLGEQGDALSAYQQALAIRRALGDRLGEGLTLSNIGTAYTRLGDLAAARDYYEQARTARLEAGDPEGEAGTLLSLGYVVGETGDQHEAIALLTQASELWRRLERPEFEGLAEHNSGGAYALLGDYERALAHFDRALTLRRQAGDLAGEAQTLNQIGSVHRRLGDYERALAYHETSLAGRRRAGDRRGEAYTLQALGQTEFDNQGYERAHDAFAKAVAMFRAIGDRDGLSSGLAYLAAAAAASGRLQLAQEAADEALRLIAQIADRTFIPTLLIHIASAELVLGNDQGASEHYRRARALAAELHEPAVEAAALHGLGRIAHARGDLRDAREALASALAIVESLRVAVTRTDLRASYLASKHSVFESYISVLMALHTQQPEGGYAAQALAVNERRRARSLLEMLFEARADLRSGVDGELLQRQKQLQEQINAKADRLTRLAAGRRTSDEVPSLQRELDALVDKLRAVWAQMRVRSPRYAALTRPVPLDVTAIQRKILDDETVLLEYALGAERSYVWAVTSTSLMVHELPPRTAVERAARQAYDLARQSTRRELRGAVRHALGELSRIVLGPVAGQLGHKRLLVVPDGVLEYVPFAALPRPGTATAAGVEEPLIVHHEVLMLPSASVMEVLRGESPRHGDGAVAVLADPVLSAHDPRVKLPPAVGQTGLPQDASHADSPEERDLARSASESGLDRLQRLPFTRLEANAIVARAGPSVSMRALDFDASRETALSADLARFHVVHFATHALINSMHPELSGVVLSLVDQRGQPQDGFLRLHDIFNLRLGARLVVLSGCQTALGKDVRGEGLIGLTRGFLHAGASAVVASLWNVRDEATAQLMARFYDGLFRQHLNPAAALRQAQLWMRQQPRWSQPASWAGFTVQGEWRGLEWSTNR